MAPSPKSNLEEPEPRRPTISVIIPHFNAGDQIIDAIRSVANQDFVPIEIIVVDDYSQVTNEALRQVADELDVKLIQLSQNSGQSCARNVGVQRAKGEWVCFLDQDDVYLPTHNSALLDVISQFPESQAVFGGFLLPNQRPGRRFLSISPHSMSLKPEKMLKSVWKGVGFVPGTMMIRRDSFLECGGFDERLRGFEDEDLVVRLLAQGYACSVTRKRVLIWRQSLASASYQVEFLDSRLLYLRKLQLQFGAIRAWSKKLTLMRFRFELLTCWDALSLGFTSQQIKAAKISYDGTGVSPLLNLSPLGKVASLEEKTRKIVERFLFSGLFKASLRFFGIVRHENSIRLGLGGR